MANSCSECGISVEEAELGEALACAWEETFDEGITAPNMERLLLTVFDELRKVKGDGMRYPDTFSHSGILTSDNGVVVRIGEKRVYLTVQVRDVF